MILDKNDEKRALVKTYDDAMELAREAHRLAQGEGRGSRTWSRLKDVSFTGRSFRDWDEFLNVCQTPRREDIQKVQDFVETLKGKMPEPRSIRRVRRRNEDGIGDINIDRILGGDADFWEDTTRSPRPSTMSITLLCNMGISCYTDQDEAFWKCAATIAVCELLETAGYTVQILMYAWSLDARYSNYPHDFMVCPVKNAGESLVPSTAVAAMSTWFYRNAVFTQFHGHGEVPCSYGMPQKAIDEYVGWEQYFDCEGTLVIPMPAVTTRESALEEGRRMLTDIENGLREMV